MPSVAKANTKMVDHENFILAERSYQSLDIPKRWSQRLIVDMRKGQEKRQMKKRGERGSLVDEVCVDASKRASKEIKKRKESGTHR